MRTFVVILSQPYTLKASKMSINAQTLFTLLEKEMGREALSHAMFSFLSSSGTPVPKAEAPSKTAPSAPAPAVETEEKPKKKAKAKRDPDAPKRPASDWCLFVKRVSEVMKENPIAGSKASAMKVASALKKGEDFQMDSVSAQQILDAYNQTTVDLANAPEVAKATDGNETDTSSTSSFTTANGEKKRGPKKGTKLTDEQKAARKAKTAENKAKKIFQGIGVPSEAAAAADDSDVQNFAPFVYQKKTFLKNGRGDVLTEDMEWVGHWDDGKGALDKSATQPADLDI